MKRLCFPAALSFPTLLSDILMLAPIDPAYATGSSGFDAVRYRCAVLGESLEPCVSAAPPLQSHVEARIEPGPQAAYLMHLGVDKATAIEQARVHGESPTLLRLRITPQVLSGEALYRRALGIGGLAPAVTESPI